MHRCNRFFIFLLTFVAVSAAFGQASSPFTRFGLGELNNNGLAQNQAMGGIGISNPSAWYINNQNPALLVFNRVTVFHGGMTVEKRTANDGTSSQSFIGGNLSYLILGLPIKPGKWTTSLGLIPYSSVNYNFTYQDLASGSNIPVKVQESAKGGVSQFYWANGVAINKWLSVGLRAAYLFGPINIKDYNSINGLSNYSALQSQYAFNGANFTVGVSYHKDSVFHGPYRLNIGGVYTFRTSPFVTHKVTTETVSNNGVVSDSTTLFKLTSKFILPQNFGVGFSFGKIDRWTIGIDGFLQDYTDYQPYQQKFSDYDPHGNPEKMTRGFRLAAGAEITPRYEDFTNYLNRVTYRVGAFYERLPFMVQGNPVNDIGGTFGFSLPVGRISTIDLGVRIGKRGVISQNSLEENYFRVYFGATINDQWFIKRKYD